MGAPDVSQKRRIMWVLGGIAFVFLLLIGRLFYLMVVQGEELQQMALSQWTRDTSMTAGRGLILDTNGVVLAQSGTAYKVLIWPNLIATDDRDRIAQELSAALDMDYAAVLSRISDTKLQQIELRRGVERETIDRIVSLKLGSGVGTAVDTKRYYPNGSLFSQLIGFTTIDGVGQAGLEQRYNEALAGKDGRTITETDRRGNALAYGTEEIVDPVDGYDLLLTADSILQSFLEKALEEAVRVNKAENAQGIIMNCKTGAILALGTKPDYDPNSPPRNDLELLAELSRQRIVTDAYEPGSTFKIITLAAAIDSGVVTLDSGFQCPGYRYVNGERVRCWKTAGHGTQNLTEAAENSCNAAFMDIALGLGEDRFYEYLQAFGFGSSTKSGIGGEASGIVTNQKYVTENTLARIGFGQSIAMTPLQLATAVSAAVNGGNLMRPYIVEKIVAGDGTSVEEYGPEIVRRVIKASSSDTVRGILQSVVDNGSGKNAAVPGYRIGGKTGTAQKYEDGAIADGKLIASFIGFAPVDDPNYVVLILVDEPKVGTIFGSTVAAPFVADVLEETLQYYGHMPEDTGEGVTVPDVTGLSVDGASDTLRIAGLTATVQGTGEVIAQIPRAEQSVVKGSNVLLYTVDTDVVLEEALPEEEQEELMVDVPELLGMTRLQSAMALKEKELIMTVPGEQKGKAIRQVPAAGTMVEKGTEILVEFSDAEMGSAGEE